jgi:gliding motility-associated-like protein
MKPTLILLSILFGLSSGLLGQPKAAFAVSSTEGCNPLLVNFTNQSSGLSSNATFEWDFGNGNRSASLNPAAIYSEEKSFSVTLTVRDNGKVYTATKVITVHPAPEFDIVAEKDKICLPAAAQFTCIPKSGNDNLTRFFWDFGDGTTIETNSHTVSHPYQTEIQPSVSLTVTNSYGCYSSVRQNGLVQLLPGLNVDFKATDSVLCRIEDQVTFSNNTTGSGTISYEWDFGDGFRSTAAAPVHVFNKAGNYSVKLVATSSEGCVASKTRTDYLNIANFKADFRITDTVCSTADLPIKFSGYPAPDKVHWTINDQDDFFEDSILVPVETSGVMKVRLIAAFDKCADTIIQERMVRPRPKVDSFVIKQLNFCEFPQYFEITDTTADAVKWEWSFNHYYEPIPTAFTKVVKQEVWAGFNTIHLKITNKEGCTATLLQGFDVSPPRLAIRSYTDLPDTYHTCDSARAKFQAFFSTSPDQKIVKYNWDFDNGTTSTEVSPIADFRERGKYHKIILDYETDKGCKGSVQAADHIYVGAGVKADFDPLPPGEVICGPSNFTLKNKSTGSSLREDWYFNGEPRGTSNIDFFGNLAKPGVYDVKLVVNDGYYCFDSITKKAAVVAVGPFPKFTNIEHSCEDRAEVTLYQETIGGTSWVWDFGDGTQQTLTTNEPFVKHRYAQSGEYYATLTATEGDCSIKVDYKMVPVMLKQNLVFKGQKDKLCKSDSLPFTITGFEPNYYVYGVGVNFERFEYEDGSIFKGFNYTNGYDYVDRGELYELDPSKKKIRAITYAFGFGCYDTTNFIDFQIIGALADFAISKPANCFNSPIELVDASTKDNATIIQWHWDFGDGTIKEFNQPVAVSHQYTEPGDYSIQLKIRDESGCGNFASTATKQVAVNGPMASFDMPAATIELNTNPGFNNTTNVFGANQVQYEWDFGDGNRSQDENPAHIYTKPGTYKVTLTATDLLSGCESVFSRELAVKNFVAGFSKASDFVTVGSCPPVVVRFTSQSQNYTRLEWDFGDGQKLENVANPSHVYEKAGKYTIKLLVYGYNGVTESVYDSIELREPTPAFSSDVLEVCKDGSFTLKSTNQNMLNYAWDFGDGTVVSGETSQAVYQFAKPGAYQPRLLVTDSNGCKKAVQLDGTLIVRDNPVIQIYPMDPEICEGASVQLTASGGQTYEWQSTGAINNSGIANPLASPSFSTEYKVTVKDDLGCSAIAATIIRVIAKEQVSLSGINELCVGERAQFLASGATRYEWINNTAGLSSTTVADPFVTALETTAYTVVGFDRKGCFSDTASIELMVRPLPTINAGDGGVVLSGNSFQINATASSDVVRYNWTPARFLDCYDCSSPLSKPVSDITYKVTVANQYGCMASDTLSLKVICGASGASIPNAFSPNNDGKNDRFVIMGAGHIKQLVIYDRWGNKVFERNNFSADDIHLFWDGTRAGLPAPSGTYVYFAELECRPGEVVTRKGSLVLIR